MQQIVSSVLNGRLIDKRTAISLVTDPDRHLLWESADRIRKHFHGSRFSLCSIINARSGKCTEDCRFCAQSARHSSNIEEYETIDTDNALQLAIDCNRHGVHRLSLVTSGKGPDQNLLDRLENIYADIEKTTKLKLCGSMGILTDDTAERLRRMGVSRYHCNLEVSRKYFKKVCTTHTWEDKVATLQTASDHGMSICSGGIIGMGETMEDRIDMAFELREIQVDSIPLNIFTPIPGTPFANLPILSVEEVMSTIAIFRFINPSVTIRIAGGRQQLREDQYKCFQAGANGAMVGNYLTTTGSAIDEDLQALTKMGFTFA